MLFEIRPDLEQSKVFEGLNLLLREVILASLQGRKVDEAQMPEGLYSAVIDNQPTFSALAKLSDRIAALEQNEKDAFRDTLDENTEPYSFLGDQELPLAVVPDPVFAELKTLANHLYKRTAKLAAVEAACGESIDDHYARFRADVPPGNGNICCVCGTESLAQMRADTDEADQWRGPYDHLLPKDEYPLYGVCPSNLIPICQTCNSKAKLAKDLLFKEGSRRISFTPWTESALPDEVRVSVDYGRESPCVLVEISSADPVRRKKLETWDDVYKIKARIEGEFTALCEKIAEDVSVSNEAVFLQDLATRAQAKAGRCRLTPFNYWRARVYDAVIAMVPRDRETLRLTISDEIRSAEQMDELFFS